MREAIGGEWERVPPWTLPYDTAATLGLCPWMGHASALDAVRAGVWMPRGMLPLP